MSETMTFNRLRKENSDYNVTILTEQQIAYAHGNVLCHWSYYFKDLIEKFNTPTIIVLKDVPFQQLKAALEFMYAGEVNIPKV